MKAFLYSFECIKQFLTTPVNTACYPVNCLPLVTEEKKHNVNPVFKSFLIFFVLLLSVSLQINAQAPVISKNVGMPSGNANCTGVAYGNGVYVSVLSGGYIYRCADGESWAKVVDAGIPAGTFTSISFGAGLFVVTGSNGLILSSADGLSWTSRTSNTSNNLFNVGYYQGAFYVTGFNATLRRSTDGITWSSITMGAGSATDMFLSVTYGNGLIVVSARNISGSGIYVYKSATGLSGSWTFQDLGFGTVNRVQYINDRFFVFLSSHEIFTSVNGSTWTNSTLSITLNLPDASTGTWNANNQIFNGFYDGTKYYFFGSSQYHAGYGSVWTATTGLNFTLQNKSAYIVPQGSAFLNGKYFQTGNEGIVSSTDGIVYKYPTGNYYSLASSGTGYVGVGLMGSNHGSIFTSNDFVNWQPKTPAVQQELFAVVYAGSKYLAAGNNTVVESADNGNTWTQLNTTAGTITSLVRGADKFVAVGYDAVNAKISYSTTGATWTTANTVNNSYFRIKYVNGQYFALGSDNTNYLGVIMHSTDGIAWTEITPSLSFPVYYFNDVVFDGSKYHFMGMEFADPVNFIYDDFFSVSTATISNPTSYGNKGTIASPPAGAKLGGDWGQGAFAYSNGRFVGAVNDLENNYETYIIYSTDGINWVAETTEETTSIGGIVAEGDVFRLLGTGDGKITVSFAPLVSVSFLNVEARAVKASSQIQWKTASEVNVKDFAIHHSADDVSWNNVGFTDASAAGAATQNYSFTHLNPVKGNNYYRIVQRDINGHFVYSKTVSVYHDGISSILSVYPNPVEGGKVNVTLPEAAMVSICNNSGAVVIKRKMKAGLQQINVSTLSKGIYIIKAGDLSARFIIQ